MPRPTNTELFAQSPNLASGTADAVALVQQAHPYAKMLISTASKGHTLVTIGYVDDNGVLWVKEVTVAPVATPTITGTVDRPDQATAPKAKPTKKRR